MATYNVSTWAEFVTAFTASGGTPTDPDIIEITADLDVNTSPITDQISSGGSKTINGNMHTIWNISVAVEFNNEIFTFKSSSNRIIWNKINFNNIYRSGMYSIFRGSSSVWMRFFDCTFVMKGPQLFNRCTLTRCAVTHTNAQWRTSYSSVDLIQTWMHYEAIFASDVTNFDFDSVETSYIEGKIDVPGYTKAGILAVRLQDSVINIETSMDYTRLSSEPDANKKVVYNTTKMTGTIGSVSNIIGVTDAQMKDAAYLSSIGFNITT